MHHDVTHSGNTLFWQCTTAAQGAIQTPALHFGVCIKDRELGGIQRNLLTRMGQNSLAGSNAMSGVPLKSLSTFCRTFQISRATAPKDRGKANCAPSKSEACPCSGRAASSVLGLSCASDFPTTVVLPFSACTSWFIFWRERNAKVNSGKSLR